MKAKEYFEQYEDLIMADQISRTFVGTKSLILEFMNEFTDLCQARHIKSYSAMYSIVNELSQKWDAICSLFEKKYGSSPLNRGAFKEFYKALEEGAK